MNKGLESFFASKSDKDEITTKLYNVNNYKPIEVNIYNSRSNVIIMMDDGWESQYRIGYNYMEKYNIKGSIAVIPSHVGTGIYHF